MMFRNTLKNIFSILLLISGIVSGAMIFFVTRSRLSAVANSHKMMLAADVLMFIYALIYIVCGLLALSRSIPRKVVRVRPFVQVGVFLAIASLIISLANGILVSHIIILAVCGILIPQIFFFIIGAIMARK